MKIINGIWSVLGRILGFLCTIFVSVFAGIVLGWCWIGIDDEIGDPIRAMWNANSEMDYRIEKK